MENLVDYIKKFIIAEKEQYYAQYGCTVKLVFGDELLIIWREKSNELEFVFDDGYRIVSEEGCEDEREKGVGTIITCGFKTPKGYISKKKLPVEIKDTHNVTLEEATEVLKYQTDAKKNTFDPFWHENEAKRRNAAAWNYIAANHIQPDVNSF
jgi:hypothetical protein